MNDDEAAEALGRWHQQRTDAIERVISSLYNSFPDWVPHPSRVQVGHALETLLNAEQTPDAIVAQVHDYLRDHSSLFFPGTAQEPAAYAYAVSYLAHVSEAISKGEVEGLQVLAGTDAARGRKVVTGSARGGQAKRGRLKVDPQKVREHYEGLKTSNARLSDGQRVQKTASKFDLSAKTVKRYLS